MYKKGEVYMTRNEINLVQHVLKGICIYVTTNLLILFSKLGLFIFLRNINVSRI